MPKCKIQMKAQASNAGTCAYYLYFFYRAINDLSVNYLYLLENLITIILEGRTSSNVHLNTNMGINRTEGCTESKVIIGNEFVFHLNIGQPFREPAAAVIINVSRLKKFF